MNRRKFLAAIAAGGIVTAEGLWVPGAKLISIPKPRVLTIEDVRRVLEHLNRNALPDNIEWVLRMSDYGHRFLAGKVTKADGHEYGQALLLGRNPPSEAAIEAGKRIITEKLLAD